jgi:hypothetical protein
MTKDNDDVDTSVKRPSTYRYALCSFCKQRHPEPTGEQCMMALLDKTERGETSGAKPKRPALATVPENDPDEGTQAERAEALPQPGGAEGGEIGHTDPGYAYLANFMMAFCQKVDDSFTGMRSEMNQLRAEIRMGREGTAAVSLPAPASAPEPAFASSSRPVLVPSNPPATFHQVSEHTPRQPSLVPRLANLRQDPVLSRQANHLFPGRYCG